MTADAVVPTRFVGSSSWPLPTGGWRTLWREVAAADLVVANNARHVLPVLTVLLARGRGRKAFLVMHGSGVGPYGGSRVFGVARAVFQRTLGWAAMGFAHPVSVSRAGVEGARLLYGVDATYLPYPLRRQPPPPDPPELEGGEALRIVWVGRLFPRRIPCSQSKQSRSSGGTARRSSTSGGRPPPSRSSSGSRRKDAGSSFTGRSRGRKRRPSRQAAMHVWRRPSQTMSRSPCSRR